MTESRSAICNLTRKITRAPEVNLHAPEVELSARFFSSNYSLQFKIPTFLKLMKTNFEELEMSKELRHQHKLHQWNQRAAQQKLLGEQKKRKKGGKNRKKREKMKIEHRKRQKSAVVVHGSFDISSLRSWQSRSFIENLVQSQKMDRFSAKLVRRLYFQYLFHQRL